MTRVHLLFLSLLSGILFFLSWQGFPFLLFIAFVPLLYIEESLLFTSAKYEINTNLRTTKNKTIGKFVLRMFAKNSYFGGIFGLSYLTFFIWNVSTTWWVCNASFGGAAMAILANSFLMAAVFWLFHITKQRLLIANWRLPTANLVLIIFWLAFEFFHHRWELTWPWLTLGNAFAQEHKWIQWYEYTGTQGGRMWVLIVNILVFTWIKQPNNRAIEQSNDELKKPEASPLKDGLRPSWRKSQKRALIIAGVISFPIIISYWMYYGYREKENPVSIVVVQPNIDPYSEKFSGIGFEEQLERMLELAKQKIDSSTDYLVFPETALTESIWENDLEQTASIKRLREFLKSYPNLKIITGASTWHFYEEGENSVTARRFKNQKGFYDAFNTAFQIDASARIQVYHKSKLVPGVERMPYPAVFGFLEDFAIDLGGTSGSLGTQEERAVFKSQVPPKGVLRTSPKSQVSNSVAPVICYESIFGEYVNEYIHNGATLIFIITNDGWWKDSPGYKQHLLYGRLRTIETRRSIARSANTGISCFVNQRGDILQPTEWWKEDVIKASINSNAGKTFYVKFGDMIGRVCFYVSGVILVFVIMTILYGATRTVSVPKYSGKHQSVDG